MQLPEVNKFDLQQQKLPEVIFLQLIQQLTKDIGEESYCAPLLSLTAQDQQGLLELVKQIFIALFDQNLEQFSQVLYLIDLPERIGKKVFTAREMDWDLFADQIIRRELLKVVLRRHYSNNDDLDS